MARTFHRRQVPIVRKTLPSRRRPLPPHRTLTPTRRRTRPPLTPSPCALHRAPTRDRPPTHERDTAPSERRPPRPTRRGGHGPGPARVEDVGGHDAGGARTAPSWRQPGGVEAVGDLLGEGNRQLLYNKPISVALQESVGGDCLTPAGGGCGV